MKLRVLTIPHNIFTLRKVVKVGILIRDDIEAAFWCFNVEFLLVLDYKIRFGADDPPKLVMTSTHRLASIAFVVERNRRGAISARVFGQEPSLRQNCLVVWFV